MSKATEITKAYSIRNMPVTLRHRIKDQASHESAQAELKGRARVTQEALMLELIEEGLKRREAKRAKK